MKIAIVGAGPGGSTCALQLARHGRHEVTLLDRDEFPRPKTCGSGLGPRCLEVLKDIDMADHFQPLAQKISGLRFVGPRGNEAEMNANQEAAWIIPRSTFDAEIAFAAERAGVSFRQNFHAKKMVRDNAGRVVGISDGKDTIETELLILADGAHSRFSVDKRPRRQIAAIMAWYEGVPYKKGILEMYFDQRVKPWYGWLFPETDTRVNVGICYDPDDPADPKRLLDEVIATHVGERLRNATQVGKYKGHPIVYAEGVGPITSPGAIWIGEAARLTNAATGEGISYAMRSACVAADVIARHERPDTSFLREYQAATAKKFALPLKTAVGFMNFVNTPAFGLASSLITSRAVKSTMRYLLANA